MPKVDDTQMLWDAVAEKNAEIERLRTELDKAHRLLSQSVGWQRDAEIIKAKQAQEIERLGAELLDLRNGWDAENSYYTQEIGRLRAALVTQGKEIDRLCALSLSYLEEVERLRIALQALVDDVLEYSPRRRRRVVDCWQSIENAVALLGPR